MYYIINITKYPPYVMSEHYYATVYNYSAFASASAIISNDLPLDIAMNCSKEYPTLYPVIKDTSERNLINKAADMIIENKNGLSAWIGVFYNGKYSKSRTLEINNDKAVLLLNEPLH